MFRDLAELPPACYLTYDHGTLQVHRYWKLHAAPHTDSPADTIERTHQLVTDAVERQLVSDVPVCTFLSGGLDSSIISEIAARKMAAQGERLCTYSVDYEDNDRYFQKSLFQPNADSDYIGLMAEAIGSDHRNVVLNNVDVAEALVEATLAVACRVLRMWTPACCCFAGRCTGTLRCACPANAPTRSLAAIHGIIGRRSCLRTHSPGPAA